MYQIYLNIFKVYRHITRFESGKDYLIYILICLLSSITLIITKSIFKLNINAYYAILAGFLFGFPMGAVAVRDLYLAGKISKTEAEALLCFTNLLGPVYFISHILPIVPDKQQLLCICKEDNAIAVCRKNSIHYPSIPFESAKLQKKSNTTYH